MLGKLSSLEGLSGLFALRSTKTFYLIQEAPRESNGLIWPKSAASSVYPLVGIKKKLIQQTQEQMPTGKKAQRMCWLHFCLFSFPIWFPCLLHPRGAFEKVRFPKMLHRDLTLSILNTSYPKPQRVLVSLPGGKFKQEFRPCHNTTKQVAMVSVKVCVLRCFFVYLFLLVFPGRTQTAVVEKRGCIDTIPLARLKMSFIDPFSAPALHPVSQ